MYAIVNEAGGPDSLIPLFPLGSSRGPLAFFCHRL